MGPGKIFTSLDLTQAYLSLQMDELSSKIQAISTQKGVYKVNRLMFGIKVAPAIWQRFISQILDGIPGVCVFFDDIKIQGTSFLEHLSRVREVLSRLLKYGLKINKEKSKFFRNSIIYLGYEISCKGLSKLKSKINAVVGAPIPRNINQLRSWLGIVNYYNRFFHNLSAKLNPLYNLLKKNEPFICGDICQKAFDFLTIIEKKK